LARNFTEGWVEFMSKKLAKQVASNLNLTQVGGKKRSKSHDVIWNIKYLTGFKWTHLSEKLAYEKAVHQQRMRTEISQAKRETDFFKANLEKSKRQEGKRKASSKAEPDNLASPTKKPRTYEFRQKETDEAVRLAKKAKTSGKKKSGLLAPSAVVSADLKPDPVPEVKREIKEESEEEEQGASPPKRRRASSGGGTGEGRRASGETRQNAAPPAPAPLKKQRQKVKKPASLLNGAKANKSSKVVDAKKKGQGDTNHAPKSAKAGHSAAKTKKGPKKTGPPPDRGELLKSLM